MKFRPAGPPRYLHQRRGLQKMIQTRGVTALLYEPGLGKTATVLDYASMLALKAEAREARVLVIAPLAALDTWVTEAEKWVHPDVDVWAEAVGGTIRQRAQALAARGGNPIRGSEGNGHGKALGYQRAHALWTRWTWQDGSGREEGEPDPNQINSTPTLPRLTLCVVGTASFSSRQQVGSRTMAEYLIDGVRRFAPDLIVVDELHLIKSWSSNSSRAISRLVPLCRRRIGLTGTVMPHALTLDSPILTPKGWKPMGEMQVGDQVIGSTGKPVSVVGVWPQGEKQVFKVTFSDGSSTDCTEDHLWTVASRGRRSRELRPLTLSTGDLVKGRSRSRPTEKEVGLFDKGGTARWAIPTVEPVEFPIQPVPLNPYLLGLLLGDGHLGHSVDFTTADEEIAKYAEDALPAGMQLTVSRNGSRASRYRITSGKKGGSLPGAKRGPAPNPVAVALDDLGLRNLRGSEKFIPETYLWNDTETRLGVLRGLMDADGTASVGSTSKFVTTSPRLAEGVKHLARSLGGYVTERIEQKQPTVMPQGHTSPARPQYVLLFGMPFNPFRVTRKAEQWRPRTEQKLRSIVSIEPRGTAPAQCITVAAEDGLFVTGDFVVTHNSPLDVAAQWRFIDPHAFGTADRPASFGAFRARYAIMGGFQGREAVGFRNLDEMQDIMARNAVVATKADSLDLPPTTDATVSVDLSGAEQDAYRQMKQELAAQLDSGALATVPNRLTQMLRLRQITAGFLPDDDTGEIHQIGESKVQTIRSLVHDTLAGEHRVVVFGAFRHEVARLSEVLQQRSTEVVTITGATPPAERKVIRERFGSDDPARIVLVAQIRTMSLAINELVTASHAVFATLPLTRDDFEQARARLDRSGQTRPVTFWHVLVPRSVDSVVLRAHRERTNLEQAVMEYIKESQ